MIPREETIYNEMNLWQAAYLQWVAQGIGHANAVANATASVVAMRAAVTEQVA